MTYRAHCSGRRIRQRRVADARERRMLRWLNGAMRRVYRGMLASECGVTGDPDDAPQSMCDRHLAMAPADRVRDLRERDALRARALLGVLLGSSASDIERCVAGELPRIWVYADKDAALCTVCGNIFGGGSATAESYRAWRAEHRAEHTAYDDGQ